MANVVENRGKLASGKPDYIHVTPVSSTMNALYTIPVDGSGNVILGGVATAATPSYVMATVTSLPDVTLSGVVPSTIGDGRKTVATPGTAEPLTTGSTPCQYVIAKAIISNGGVAVVGGSTVVATPATRRGTSLSVLSGIPETITIPIDNLNKVYVDTVTPANGIIYTYVY